MQEWVQRLKALTNDELITLDDSLHAELVSRSMPTKWERCRRCNGTGKHAGGYCTCALGRDVRLIEVGHFGSYYGSQPAVEG